MLKVRFFARYRDLAGKSSAGLQMRQNISVAELTSEVASAYLQLAPYLSMALIAVNGEYMDKNHILKDGDEVAFLPPLSGG